LFLDLVQRLREECKVTKTPQGNRRTPLSIAWSFQTYLIFSIIACVPDRQRTIRELEIGKTLVYDKKMERWTIKHNAGDYKTGRIYGDRPPLVLSPVFYEELHSFIDIHRKSLNPKHRFLFSKRNGNSPLDDNSVYKLFTTASCRITGTSFKFIFITL
jgi:hypothetical protein